MRRSLEPIAADPARTHTHGGMAATAPSPAAERLAAWVDRGLRPGGLAPRRALLGALLSMAVIFGVDLLTGETVRLEALYVFPIASVALHCERRSDVVVSIVVAVALQSLGLGVHDAAVLTRVVDGGVAVAASLLAVALARTLRRHYRASEERAATDPLTGLPNRASVHEFVNGAIARGAGRDTFVALLFCDVDRFKLVNDSHGHGHGDELLLALHRRQTRAVEQVRHATIQGGHNANGRARTARKQ
ncbi:MAG: diguanylate cyclase, partial [Burkholderiales bacterium]